MALSNRVCDGIDVIISNTKTVEVLCTTSIVKAVGHDELRSIMTFHTREGHFIALFDPAPELQDNSLRLYVPSLEELSQKKRKQGNGNGDETKET